MSRAKKAKHVFGESCLIVSQEQKQFATPEIVALYRAEKLACKVIVDLCSGYGFQAFAFSQFCTTVIAVEKDPEKVSQAKEYARILGIKNIIFLCGNVLDKKIVLKIAEQHVDVVFCDPERLPDEKKRTLQTIEPNMQKVVELYKPLTEQIAFELPPQMRDIAFDGEYEYLSVDGAVNRLTVYLGKLKSATKSVVLLPHGERVEKNKQTYSMSSHVSTAGFSYVLEPNPAVVLADLFVEALCYGIDSVDEKKMLNDIKEKSIVQITQQNKCFFLSKEKIVNPFFSTYHILQAVKYHVGNKEQQKKLVSVLQKEGAENIVLRYPLDPKEYWNERNALEKQIQHGYKTVHLFLFDMALVAEKVEK